MGLPEMSDYTYRVTVSPRDYEGFYRTLAKATVSDKGSSEKTREASRAILEKPQGFFEEIQRKFLQKHAQNVRTIAEELFPKVRAALPFAVGEKEWLDIVTAIYGHGYIYREH